MRTTWRRTTAACAPAAWARAASSTTKTTSSPRCCPSTRKPTPPAAVAGASRLRCRATRRGCGGGLQGCRARRRPPPACRIRCSAANSRHAANRFARRCLRPCTRGALPSPRNECSRTSHVASRPDLSNQMNPSLISHCLLPSPSCYALPAFFQAVHALRRPAPCLCTPPAPLPTPPHPALQSTIAFYER